LPYENAVEDYGNTSFVMLTDRPKDSAAVLKGKFGKNDPTQRTNPDIMKEDGGVISLKDKAVNMNRGPRGIEPFIKYMANGGYADDDFGGFSGYSEVDNTDFSNSYNDSDGFDDGGGRPEDYGLTQQGFTEASNIGASTFNKNQGNTSNIVGSSSYDPQFTANNLLNRGLTPSNFMGTENFAKTTQRQPSIGPLRQISMPSLANLKMEKGPIVQPTIEELKENLANLKLANSVTNRFSPQTPFSKYSSPEDPTFIPNKQVNPELYNQYQGYKSGVEFGDVETGMDLLSATKFDPLLQAGLKDMRSLSDYAQVIKPTRRAPIDNVRRIRGQYSPYDNNIAVMPGAVSGGTLAHELMHKGAQYLAKDNKALESLLKGGKAEHRYIQSVANMSFMNKMMNEQSSYLNKLFAEPNASDQLKTNIKGAVLRENKDTLLNEVDRVMDFYYSPENRSTLFDELNNRLDLTPTTFADIMRGELQVDIETTKQIFTIANEVMANDFAASRLGKNFKKAFDKSDRQEGFFDTRFLEEPQEQPTGQEPPRSMAEGGVISLKDTAVKMFEDGGEAKYEQGQGLGDVEMRADLEPYLYGNPLARLGYELYKEGAIKISGAPVDEALDSFGLYSDKKKEIAYVANQREDAPNPLRILTHELSHAAIAYLEGKDKANKAGFNKYGNVDYEEGVVRGGDVLIDRRAPTKSKLAQDFFGNIQPTKAGLKQFMRVSRAAQENLDNRGIPPEVVAERETGFYGTSGKRIPTAMENFKNLFGMDVDPNVNNYLNLTGYTVNYAEGGVVGLKDKAVNMHRNMVR